MYRALLAWKQAWYLNYQQCSYVSAWTGSIRLWCLLRFCCLMTLTVILQLKKAYTVIFKPFTCSLQRLKVLLVILWSALLQGWVGWKFPHILLCRAHNVPLCLFAFSKMWILQQFYLVFCMRCLSSTQTGPSFEQAFLFLWRIMAA